jgi:hypothetical protein
MALTGRIGKLEDRAAVTGTAKGVIADWALKYVQEEKAKMLEGRTGEILRQLGVSPVKDPAKDEADTLRQAQYLTETYPNLEAGQRGESKSAKRVHEMLAPLFKEAS